MCSEEHTFRISLAVGIHGTFLGQGQKRFGDGGNGLRAGEGTAWGQGRERFGDAGNDLRAGEGTA